MNKYKPWRVSFAGTNDFLTLSEIQHSVNQLSEEYAQKPPAAVVEQSISNIITKWAKKSDENREALLYLWDYAVNAVENYDCK